MSFVLQTAEEQDVSLLRVVAPCSLVAADRRFSYSYYLNNEIIALIMKKVRTSETSCASRRLHGAISQKVVIFMLRHGLNTRNLLSEVLSSWGCCIHSPQK
jgi:hypothetical protein